jgi:hypothetical protein
MTAAALREHLHQYIEHADESFLRVVKAMMDEHFRVQQEQDIELTAEQKQELDERYARFERGEGLSFSFDELKDRLLVKRKKAG